MLTRADTIINNDYINVNLGDISYSPKSAHTGDIVEITVVVENNSILGGTDAKAGLNLYEEGSKFDEIRGEARGIDSGSKREWLFKYEMPDHSVSFEALAIDMMKDVIRDPHIDDRSGMRSIEHLREDEPGPGEETTMEMIKKYSAPVGFGGAVGFGVAELYNEPSLPIVALGAGTGASLQYAGDKFSSSLEEMNLPTWSIWGISLGVIGSGMVLGQFTDIMGG